MVRLTTIYTKGGDSGTTALVGGERVDKDHLRVDAYGTVDEVNAAVGLARAFAAERAAAAPRAAARLEAELARVQNLLFDLGSDLATREGGHGATQPRVGAEDVSHLEALIDELNGELPPLESFVLPGGGPVSGFLHQARTICRRAERRIFRLTRLEPVGEWVLPFVNRLSDAFFVLARWAGKELGETELLWRR